MQNSCKAHSVSEIPATMHMKIWRRSAVAQICLSAYRWVTDSFSPSGCFQTLYWILILSVWGCMQTHFAFPPEPSSWARAKETKEIHSKVTCRISKVRSRVALFAFRLHLLLFFRISPNVSTAMKSFHEWLQIMWMVHFCLSNLFRSSPSCSESLGWSGERSAWLDSFFTIHTLQKSRPPFNFTNFYQKPEVRTQIRL